MGTALVWFIILAAIVAGLAAYFVLQDKEEEDIIVTVPPIPEPVVRVETDDVNEFMNIIDAVSPLMPRFYPDDFSAIRSVSYSVRYNDPTYKKDHLRGCSSWDCYCPKKVVTSGSLTYIVNVPQSVFDSQVSKNTQDKLIKKWKKGTK